MNILQFKDCSYKNKDLVGGKCSSLGELYKLSQTLNFEIADGFAITTTLYDTFIQQNELQTIIENELNDLNHEDINELEKTSLNLINLITNAKFDEYQEQDIIENYQLLCNKYNQEHVDVAIRSSAIAEDLPNASFAGQQDTYLNITHIGNVLSNVKKCFASLFNVRALSYRYTHDIKLEDVKISVAVQKMVRSDIGSAGVAFSLDPESGYNKAIVINSSFGLGELVVSGGVKPDEVICNKDTLSIFDADPIVMKKLGSKDSKIIYNSSGGIIEIETNIIEKLNYSITNNQAIALARYVMLLEKEYCKLLDKVTGVDVEWAIDGKDKKIYILQSRPETVHSNKSELKIEKYVLDEKSEVLVKGVAVGEKISSGKIKILKSLDDHAQFSEGDILVTSMTTPDWEPLMKKSSGIITNKGGRTCHAAIVAREMGLNAVVGTINCTEILKNVDECTIFCADGEEGLVYNGQLGFHIDEMTMDNSKTLPIDLMMNVGNPETSFTNSMIPNKGVGLTRLEFIINNYIKIHPKALIDYPNVPKDLREKIYNVLGDRVNGEWYFIKRLARGIAKIASAFSPNDVIVRFSDFKSNEYKNLLGGEIYEPDEENPMIGWRGASRYYSPEYEKAFELECKAIKYVRETMRMTNVVVMIPFCRTPTECEKVLEIMKKHGLERGENGLKVFLMCEIPSNVIEADEFSKYVDGVSIGGNDLLQLTLGVDRDSEKITHLSSHENVSYRRMISQAIKTYKQNGVKVGFCGQQPSDSIEFCNFLITEGIDSISVTPDSILKTINNLSMSD
uniref:pyruvate, water dikinase n=1 Tax=viral metagenome TaxID=1070528 RepID=A0A6C0LFP4_9ZZZZ